MKTPQPIVFNILRGMRCFFRGGYLAGIKSIAEGRLRREIYLGFLGNDSRLMAHIEQAAHRFSSIGTVIERALDGWPTFTICCSVS